MNSKVIHESERAGGMGGAPQRRLRRAKACKSWPPALEAHSCRQQAPTDLGKHPHTKEQLPRIPQWWKNNNFLFWN